MTKISHLHVIDCRNVSSTWISDSYEKNGTFKLDFCLRYEMILISVRQNSDELSSEQSEGTCEEEEEKAASIVRNPSDSDRCLFDCLVEGCTAQYRYHANLLRHYATGKHNQVLEKYSLIDKSKLLFHRNLLMNQSRTTPTLSITVVPSPVNLLIRPLHPSWALQKSRSNARFNEKQRTYLAAKFKEGVTTGREY